MNTEELLKERGKSHGDYSETARVQQAIKFAIKHSTRYDGLPDIMRESLDMLAHKIGRIISGNPYTTDHWRDICGYCQLVIDRIDDGVGLRKGLGQAAPPDDPMKILTHPDIDRTQLSEEGRYDLKRAEELWDRLPRNRTSEFKVGPIEPVPPIVPRHEPAGSHTPEDGGHHAQRAEEPAFILSLTEADVGKHYRTRGGEVVQILHFKEAGSKNFPVLVSCSAGDTLREAFRTRRGRVNWQIEPHADDAGDLIEVVEAVAG